VMSTTPVKEEETSPLRSEVSSESISTQSNSPDKMDKMMSMLMNVNENVLKLSTDLNEVKQIVTWLEDKKSPGGSPRDKVSSSLFVDVVTTEWDQAGRSITHSTPGPPSPDSKGRRQRDEVYTKGGQRTDTEESLKVESTDTTEAHLPFGGDQVYDEGLLTGVVPNRRKLASEQSFIDNVPKHFGHTKVTQAPVSRGARPESLNLHLEEPPDIQEIVADAVHKAMDVEAMKKHLLLVGAIKDEDVRRAELNNDINYVNNACNDIVDWPDLLDAEEDEARAFKDERSRVPSVLALAGEANNPASLKATFKGFILQELTVQDVVKWLGLKKTYKERYPSEWRRQWHLTVDPKVWTEVRTKNFDRRAWCERFIADNDYPIAVEGLERGFAADQITDREQLAKTINSTRSVKSLKLKFVLKPKAALQDLPESRFTLMLLVAITPRTPVQFHTAWRTSMKHIVEDLGIADWSDTSEKNFYHRNTVYQEFLREVRVNYDFIRDLQYNVSLLGVKVETPTFKGIYGHFETLESLFYDVGNSWLLDRFKEMKMDPTFRELDAEATASEHMKKGRRSSFADTRVERQALQLDLTKQRELVSVIQCLKSLKNMFDHLYAIAAKIREDSEKPRFLKRREKERKTRGFDAAAGATVNALSRPMRQPPPRPQLRNVVRNAPLPCADDDGYNSFNRESDDYHFQYAREYADPELLHLQTEEVTAEEYVEYNMAPQLAYLPASGARQSSALDNRHTGAKVCASGIFTGYCSGCEGCKCNDIANQRAAIKCFKAQLASREDTLSKHKRNVDTHDRALQAGKIIRYSPRPGAEAPKMMQRQQEKRPGFGEKKPGFGEKKPGFGGRNPALKKHQYHPNVVQNVSEPVSITAAEWHLLETEQHEPADQVAFDRDEMAESAGSYASASDSD